MVDAIVIGIDTMWVILAAVLIYFMHAGFTMLEIGFIRSKNTVNIIMKNFVDICFVTLVFFAVGYAFMFGSGNNFIGHSGFFLKNATNNSGVHLYAMVLFQIAFASAAATILAGAVCERMKFSSYIVYSILITAFVYPIVGHWVWGGGFLADMDFADFAGSTVIHLLGGLSAFIGALIVGPRIGKYNKDGSANIIAGHNMPLAALGTFILWVGWFGFNAGSTLAVGDGSLIARIALNTNLAASAGGATAMLYVWAKFGKPDLGLSLNGMLAGLVAVTAPCAFIEPGSAIIIGAVAGIIMVHGVILLDKVHVDDPVGAFPVHALNGVWGTLAVGLFGKKSLGLARDGLFYGGGAHQLLVQLFGVIVVAIFVAITMTAIFLLLKATIGVRVSRIEELKGLDITAHGMESYSEFQIFTNR